MRAERIRYGSWGELPMCGVQRVGRYANDKPSTDYQCSHRARFRLDGVNLCTKHAGVAALAYVLQHCREDGEESEFEVGG